MNCDERELCYLAQTHCLFGKSNLGVIENSLMSLAGGGVRKKMYQIK